MNCFGVFMCIVGSPSSFSIYDSKNTMVFDLNAENRTYRFFHKTLELEVQQGIEISPLARKNFEGHALVEPAQVSFDLF